MTRFDRYYRYDELAAILKEYAARHPGLVGLQAIGKSWEGRHIFLVTVTNAATGSDQEKPALWVDGNIHSAELAGSSACLYLIDFLVKRYGRDDDVTRCLDTRTFYVCPRVNPDGAEWALEKKPRLIRSSTRPYPYDEEPIGGLAVGDIDNDDRILTMRIPDSAGPWKVCLREPRLMVRRDPIESAGQYYRLLPEGELENYDGTLVSIKPRKERLDLNRNFPGKWRPEHEQQGAGPYPVSEPEARAVVDFIAHHANIIGAIAFHTYSGVILRPYGHQSDESFPAEDLWSYCKIGDQGTELTGYPSVSAFHEFRYHPNKTISGTFDDWMYDDRGVFGWTVELWSPQREAGIKDYKYIDWYREHPLEDDLKMLAWSDAVLEGKGYIDWYPFEHPQLGRIELGGWNSLYAFQNPPPEFLEKEITPFARWLVWHLLISPRLELLEASAKPLGRDLYQVRLVVENTGWLPSYVTKKALEKKLTRGVIAEIKLPEDAVLEAGKPREEGEQLEGRAYHGCSPAGGWSDLASATDNRAKFEWVVRASGGGIIELTARHERGGVVRAEIELS
jgi:murein tripeptide amidase MpaA